MNKLHLETNIVLTTCNIMNTIKLPDSITHSFNDLYKLSVACIYAIKCDATKKVYVGYSKNLLTSLGRIMDDVVSYGTLKNDIDRASIEILCTDASILNSTKITRLNVSLYAQQYKDAGYSFYKPTNLVNYRVDVKIYASNYKAWYVVDLINSRNEKILVGVFDREKECKAFLNQYYPDGKVTHFYSANNKYTIEWRDKYDDQTVLTELVRVE